MNTITVNYTLKWRLKSDNKYQWSTCGKLFNVQRNKMKKKVQKSELIKVSDFELYHLLVEQIDIYAQQVAKEAAADAWDAAMRYINDDSDFPMGEGKKKYPSKTEYLNQKFPTNPNK